MVEKPVCRAQLARMLRLLLELRARRFPDAGDLAKVCEVSRRTVYRDLDVLVAAGVPVEYRTDRRGYEIGPGFFLELTRFEETEVFALILQAHGPTAALSDITRTVLAKIILSMPENSRARCSTLLGTFEEPASSSESRLILEIAERLAEGQEIRVGMAEGDVRREICLQNCRLICESGSWILTGIRTGRDPKNVRIPVSEMVEVTAERRCPVDSRASPIKITSVVRQTGA